MINSIQQLLLTVNNLPRASKSRSLKRSSEHFINDARSVIMLEWLITVSQNDEITIRHTFRYSPSPFQVPRKCYPGFRFASGCRHISPSTPGAQRPVFSVTRLTVGALAENKRTDMCCKALIYLPKTVPTLQ
jgi:hypothetical protein